MCEHFLITKNSKYNTRFLKRPLTVINVKFRIHIGIIIFIDILNSNFDGVGTKRKIIIIFHFVVTHIVLFVGT